MEAVGRARGASDRIAARAAFASADVPSPRIGIETNAFRRRKAQASTSPTSFSPALPFLLLRHKRSRPGDVGSSAAATPSFRRKPEPTEATQPRPHPKPHRFKPVIPAKAGIHFDLPGASQKQQQNGFRLSPE
ncbi:hypothetical protein RDV84_16315 [Lysobacter yananisis]|uniref:Uncharacterized protein n=1 Tax=Lysobacter yananisis TaxID=1003114 RepID=A0ABY9P5C4_9GAMM|nr:hypothetical protein [Lysobacter yananisis]WMT01539.1 hypothetical protein RDV84_16315 [Lysobacter yananisis]